MPSAMTKSEGRTCEHCASDDVHPFTPERHAAPAAVLLCMSCRRLTILPPVSSRMAGPVRLQGASSRRRAA